MAKKTKKVTKIATSTAIRKTVSQTDLKVKGDSNAATTKRKARRSKSNDLKDSKKQKVQEMELLNHQPGLLVAVGSGDLGQLGLGENLMDRKKPAIVKELRDLKVSLVVAAGVHTCCVTTEGEMYSFGCNDEGALGREAEDSEYDPLPVEMGELAGKKVHQVTAGDSHTAALTSMGEVFVWGNFRDSHGAMGLLKPKEKCLAPQKLPMPGFVKQIASGNDHFMMLSRDGKVYSIGAAENGQLGRIGHWWCDRANITGKKKGLMLVPLQVNFPRRKGGKPKIVQIFCGDLNSYALSNEGEVYVWGLNNYNQLGVAGTETSLYMPVLSQQLSLRNITCIVAGKDHTAFLTEEGRVYSLGYGQDGRLGQGKEVEHTDTPGLVPNVRDVVQLSSRGRLTYALDKEGVAWAWGPGTHYQLTDKEGDDHWEPLRMTGKQLEDRKVVSVSAGGQHGCLILSPM